MVIFLIRVETNSLYQFGVRWLHQDIIVFKDKFILHNF